MKPMISLLLLCMPRWLASFSTVVLLLLVVGVLGGVVMQPTVVSGRPVSIAPVPGSEKVLLEIAAPWSATLRLSDVPEHRLVAIDDVQVDQINSTRVLWVLALGEEVRQVGRFSVVEGEELVMVGMPSGIGQLPEVVGEMLVIPLLAVSLGALLIIAGPLFSRLFSALVLGALMGIATWHGLHYARFSGEIVLVDALIDLSAWLAVFVGLVIGLRARRDQINIALERLILMVLVILAAPVVAEGLGLPADGLAIVGALLTLLSPVVGYALLGSHALALAMHAGTGASWFVLALALLIALVMRAAFSSDNDPVIRRVARYIDSESGRIPFNALFPRGRS